MEALLSPKLQWGGNIRELEAILKRARNRARAGESLDPVIEARHLDLGDMQAPSETSARPTASQSSVHPGWDEIRERWQQIGGRQDELDALERSVIEDALATCHGIVARTARMLDVPRTGLISRMGRLNIDPSRFKEPRN
jgi:transcriptional regulator with GAF, ATPase, and Fis domain